MCVGLAATCLFLTTTDAGAETAGLPSYYSQFSASGPQGILLPHCALALERVSSKVPLYDPKAVSALLGRATPEYDNPKWIQMLKRLEGADPERALRSAPSAEEIEALGAAAPNFSEVVSYLKLWATMQHPRGLPMKHPPLLLLGDPGVGKTYFAQTYARILGTRFKYVSMADLTAGWILSGTHPSYKNPSMGKVAEVLIEGPDANPVMMLDEIDKASQRTDFSPLAPLYQLLEKAGAQTFQDEFTGFPVDASHAIWIATANSRDAIPEPILSRMKVFTVRATTPEENKIVAKSIYGRTRQENGWEHMAPELSDEVLTRFALFTPRELTQEIPVTMLRANAAGRASVQVSDIAPAQKGKPPIGFVH